MDGSLCVEMLGKGCPWLAVSLPSSPGPVSPLGPGLKEIQDWKNRSGRNSSPKVLHPLLPVLTGLACFCSFGEGLSVGDVFYLLSSKSQQRLFWRVLREQPLIPPQREEGLRVF